MLECSAEPALVTILIDNSDGRPHARPPRSLLAISWRYPFLCLAFRLRAPLFLPAGEVPGIPVLFGFSSYLPFGVEVCRFEEVGAALTILDTFASLAPHQRGMVFSRYLRLSDFCFPRFNGARWR